MKYRVWDKKFQIFACRSTDFHIGANGFLFIHISQETQICDAERFIVCLATGLKDKNGKEIYENDILEYERPPDCVSSDELYSGSNVIMEKRRFPVISRHENPSIFFVILYEISICDWEYEVVGNTFENPELLNNP